MKLAHVIVIVTAVTIILVSTLVLIFFLCKKRRYSENITITQQPFLEPQPQKAFAGLCLFDVDGTLTNQGLDAHENAKRVQICLDNGYAVGINTAGGIYTPDRWTTFPNNHPMFRWMPENLYNFMKKHNWITFNNVVSFYLNGKKDEKSYRSVLQKVPPNVSPYGFLKGFAMQQTANKLGIFDPNRIVMFDDLPQFIDAIKQYNPLYRVICIDKDLCGGFTTEAVYSSIVHSSNS